GFHANPDAFTRKTGHRFLPTSARRQPYSFLVSERVKVVACRRGVKRRNDVISRLFTFLPATRRSIVCVLPARRVQRCVCRVRFFPRFPRLRSLRCEVSPLADATPANAPSLPRSPHRDTPRWGPAVRDWRADCRETLRRWSDEHRAWRLDDTLPRPAVDSA